MLRVEVSKNSSAAAPSKVGGLETSMTTDAPASTSASPRPVVVSTPELREAATASQPSASNLVTILDPMSPVPPITMIFTTPSVGLWQTCIGGALIATRSADP